MQKNKLRLLSWIWLETSSNTSAGTGTDAHTGTGNRLVMRVWAKKKQSKDSAVDTD